MATIEITKKYRCSDDCIQSGCPGHESKLTFQSTSDAYVFENGKGDKVFFERGELESFISILKDLNAQRVDCARI
jgi:hypothetical protein